MDVLSFSLGEPDFEPPEHVLRSAGEAIQSGCSKYTTARGILKLREAICDDSESRRGVRHTPDEVVVSVGAKHTLFNLAFALFEPGDEVIIPAPHWVSYPAQVKLAGAEPVVLATDATAQFKITAEQLERAIAPKTKAVVLCSPSNPTGAAYDRTEVRALCEVLAKHDVWTIVDEIYGRLVYGDFEHVSPITVAPELKDKLVIVDGVSKTFAMTGWRIGWMLAPAELCKACDKVQGQATTNPAAVSQHAALAAVAGPQDAVEHMRQTFQRRRDLVVQGLNDLPGVSCRLPEGAFYAFPCVQELLSKRAGDRTLTDDIAVAQWLIDEARCALVPGSAFGAPGYLRMSYAASESQLKEGLGRIRQAVEKL